MTTIGWGGHPTVCRISALTNCGPWLQIALQKCTKLGGGPILWRWGEGRGGGGQRGLCRATSCNISSTH